MQIIGRQDIHRKVLIVKTERIMGTLRIDTGNQKERGIYHGEVTLMHQSIPGVLLPEMAVVLHPMVTSIAHKVLKERVASMRSYPIEIK